MEREITILQGIRVTGYVNLFILVFLLLGAKTMNLMLLTIPVGIALCGVVVYGLFWSKLFSFVNRKEGRKYMSPYILGVTLFVGAVILVYSLAYIHEYKNT